MVPGGDPSPPASCSFNNILFIKKSLASLPTYSILVIFVSFFFFSPPPFFLLIEGLEEMNSVDDLCESIYVLFYSNMYFFGWFDKCLCLSFQSISSVFRYL